MCQNPEILTSIQESKLLTTFATTQQQPYTLSSLPTTRFLSKPYRKLSTQHIQLFCYQQPSSMFLTSFHESPVAQNFTSNKSPLHCLMNTMPPVGRTSLFSTPTCSLFYKFLLKQCFSLFQSLLYTVSHLKDSNHCSNPSHSNLYYIIIHSN